MDEKATDQNNVTAIDPYKKVVFEEWLTWKAQGGLMVDEENGRIYKMTLEDFCRQFGVAKTTANEWRKRTPNLAARIEQRRNEIAPTARVSLVYNQLFLMSMQSQDKRAAVDAQKTFLGHFGNLQLPVQRQDIKVQGGLTDVLMAAERDGILEGEIVEPSPTDTGAGDQAPGTLPLPS